MTTTTKTYNYDPKVPVYASPDVSFKAVNLDTSKMQKPSSMVDKGTATVAGQLNGLLSSGSPLLNAAQSSAQRAANARGLLNSSIAAGEGTKAMIETATPIAQQDAQLYGDLTKANNDTMNSSLLNNQVSNLETNKAVNEGKITGAINQQQISGNLEQQKLEGSQALQQEQLSSDNRLTLQELEGKQGLELQSATDKAAYTRAQLEAQNSLELQKLSDAGAMQRQQAENANSVTLQKLSDAAALQRQITENQNSIALQKLSDMNAMDRQKVEAANSIALQKLSDAGALTRTNAENANATALQKMQDSAAYERSKLENETQKLVSSMEVAQNNKEALMAVISNMGQDMISSINSILLDTKLDGNAKTSAIQSIMANYKASVNTASSVAGLNLTWGTESVTSPATTTTKTSTTNTGAAKPATGTTSNPMSRVGSGTVGMSGMFGSTNEDIAW